jgi:hypothetical protein
MTNTPLGPTATWFDPSVIGQITVPQLAANGEPGMFGYMGRNVLTGPGRNNWDLALLKNFSAPWFGAEKSSIQFRLETFNTFNHTQFQNVDNGLGNSRFGQFTSAYPARIVQLAGKVYF